MAAVKCDGGHAHKWLFDSVPLSVMADAIRCAAKARRETLKAKFALVHSRNTTMSISQAGDSFSQPK
jgi:hypothetical protein